jgi:tetratricopeptide (TPR) repeat protein
MRLGRRISVGCIAARWHASKQKNMVGAIFHRRATGATTRTGRSRSVTFSALVCAALALGMCPLASAAVPQAQQSEELQTAEHGVSLLMNAHIRDAVQVFHQIQSSDPSSPLGYLLEADADWWKIYLRTGNLVDPDVFDVVSSESTPYDAHFDETVRQTIAKAEANIQAHRDVARNEMYEGLAYALRARLLGLRGKDLPTARAGKKMRSLLMDAVEKDPSLADAYLGIGIYNYFVDTLPGIVKLLRWLIGLPGGDRQKGLEQLQDTADHGSLTSGEALFYLGKDYSRSSEGHFDKSLEYFEKLARRYPDNGLWKILSGSIEIRLSHRDQGEKLYKEVFAETRGEASLPAQALHHAARNAIERMDPAAKLSD